MSNEQPRLVVISSRLMLGGRIYSEGDLIDLPDARLTGAALRSGAVLPLPGGLDFRTFPDPSEDRMPLQQ